MAKSCPDFKWSDIDVGILWPSNPLFEPCWAPVRGTAILVKWFKAPPIWLKEIIIPKIVTIYNMYLSTRL